MAERAKRAASIVKMGEWRELGGGVELTGGEGLRDSRDILMLEVGVNFRRWGCEGVD